MEYLLIKYGDEFNGGALSYYGYMEEKSGLVSGDAEVLYAMVREMKPRRIVEVGAGGSTQIIAAALRKNYLETRERALFYSIDPYMPSFLGALAGTLDEFVRFTPLSQRVQDADISVFGSLGEGDVLFVDSSHVFKQGSDVEFEFLCVYPILKKGILVHIHDIFFPFDYPLEWNNKEYWFWNEQYFLETFLQCNSRFEVLASLSLVSHHNDLVFSGIIKTHNTTEPPHSFWMKSI